MPDAQMRSFAKKSGHSMADIERYWDDSKKESLKKFGSKKAKGFWPYVVGIVERRAGLRKGKVKESLTFSNFMMLEAKKKPEQTGPQKFHVHGYCGINSWEYEITANSKHEAEEIAVKKAEEYWDKAASDVQSEPLDLHNRRRQEVSDEGKYW